MSAHGAGLVDHGDDVAVPAGLRGRVGVALVSELLKQVPGYTGELVPGCVYLGDAGHFLEVRSRKGSDALA